jgi:hypothetical protein
MKKYLCIGCEVAIPHDNPPEHIKLNKNYYAEPHITAINAQWLPRWYGVPYEECVFTDDPTGVVESEGTYYGKAVTDELIVLKYRPDGDYEEHLAVLKTERLLNS